MYSESQMADRPSGFANESKVHQRFSDEAKRMAD